MVASHVSEYGDFGKFLSNHHMYVNQFYTWWPDMLANLANTTTLPNIYLMKCNTLLECLLFIYAISMPVSYTHLTLPTNREV